MGPAEGRQQFNDRGTIVEIKLQNFITYGDAVIHPGRHLNVIIGPNGTGKSTIATALALGFGGTTKLIGKPDMHVGATIKAGCDKARIDITIRNTPTENMVFSRTIDRQSKSSYFINNVPMTLVKFKEAVQGFHIQVDNLTQFLPQENIKGFSELNGKDLLLSTERSVSDTSLEANHETLIDNRRRQKVLEDDIAQRTARMEAQERRYASLSEEVQQFKERKNLKKKLEALKQKRAWVEYDIQRRAFGDSKKRRDEAAARRQQCDDRLKPIDQMIRALKTELKTLERKLSSNTTKTNDFNQIYKKCLDDIDDLKLLVKGEHQKCNLEIDNEKKRDEKIHTQRQMSEKYENDLLALEEEFGTENVIRQQINELNQKIDVNRKATNQLSEDFTSKKAQFDQLTYQMSSMKREQQQLKDIETKRLEILRSRSKDAYTGVIWLRQNDQLFRKKVWEPMMLNIQVKGNQYSKFFENVLAQRDLVSFVCEDKDDMSLLVNHLRNRQNLTVNIVHSDVYRPVNMSPRAPLNEIRRFGFTNYLIDLVEAPEPILKYIVHMYHIQNIPIGTADVDKMFEQVPSYFFTFFSPTKIYGVSKSQYSGQKSTTIREISSTGTLSLVLDSAKINAIEERIQTIMEKKDVAAQNAQMVDEKLTQEKRQLEKLREDKQTLVAHCNRIQNTMSKIQDAERKLRQLEAERIDIEDIKKQRDGVVRNLIKKQIKFYDQIKHLGVDIYKVVKVSEAIELSVILKTNTVSKKEKESRALREESKEAERVYKELDAVMKELNDKTQECLNEAKELTNGVTSKTDPVAWAVFNAAFIKLPASLDAIEDMIDNTSTRIYVCKNNPEAENIVKEHEKMGSQIQKHKEELEIMTSELQQNYADTEKVKDLWLPSLRALVERISGNFSGYLEKLGCAGEVQLIHGENPSDYGEYALKIMVKFRDNEPLQEFTKSRQSGGETSLTTAMYMIALQEMSQVPFRVVDEINQGMDATNDRKVFEHIMDITSRGSSSQYFLLTPKLLPNLPYNDVVTVLCVFSGPSVVPHSVWTIPNYVKRLKRRKRQKIHDK